MRVFIFTVALLLLFGCSSKTTVTTDLIADVSKMVDSLEQTMPKDCKTELYDKQVTIIKSQIEIVEKTYKAEVAEVRAWGEKYQERFYILALAVISVIGYIVIRFLKKRLL